MSRNIDIAALRRSVNPSLKGDFPNWIVKEDVNTALPWLIIGEATHYDNVDSGNDVLCWQGIEEFKNAHIAGNHNLEPYKIRMLWQHDPDKPIGEWFRAYDTPKHSIVAGIIKGANSSQAHKHKFLLNERHINMLSIGYRTLEFSYGGGLRVLHKISVREISVIGFAMNPRTIITHIRQLTPDMINTTIDLEPFGMTGSNLEITPELYERLNYA